ncbi:IS30 family transposase [Candidatus Shapirobacteria bacterium CG_4_10_14_0_2_um_filter_40_12]|uniref:IS30 family transposase n=1 Tax=Candidatus Shapirobacteria bacterium CG_4_10_14_0_2_um_filter_40_12 TaxID=1974871 RepID=A0A2M7TU20_9BACT|nr:MAG: IS30 family transposase [Candidatus Shapirobacteria bacterium CG_4_10_14_0_2_um_filter_40_12]
MQIQPNEQDKIAVWFGSGLSVREISRHLDRNPSTICRELKRNRFGDGYVAIHAQTLVNKRKIVSRHRHPLKNALVYSYVLEKLKESWTPEQISGRLELENGRSIICRETIYAYVHKDETKDKRLWEYLTLKRKKRKKKYGRKVTRVRIPNRVSIHLRDESIETRETFGHYEGDSVIGRQTKGRVIHTEVEKKTRYLQAIVIDSKSATDTLEAQKQIFTELPAKTVTMDNGLEFTKHEELNRLGIKTFFADPYCSGQRGTNENTNGLIRRYLPKKTSFDNLAQTELDDIVFEINNRPKKVLKFSTPFEALQKELSIIGIAFPNRM